MLMTNRKEDLQSLQMQEQKQIYWRKQWVSCFRVVFEMSVWHISGDVQLVYKPEAWEGALNFRWRFGNHQLQMVVETLQVG